MPERFTVPDGGCRIEIRIFNGVTVPTTHAVTIDRRLFAVASRPLRANTSLDGHMIDNGAIRDNAEVTEARNEVRQMAALAICRVLEACFGARDTVNGYTADELRKAMEGAVWDPKKRGGR